VYDALGETKSVVSLKLGSTMSEGRAEAEILGELETLSLDLVKRLDLDAERAKNDPVAMDELFVLAGQADAILRAMSERLRALRARLEVQSRN
jgi:hypothetical protein